ncbi:MAG: PLP-dependent aminotransferase family protein [Armatimonadetes bacterium]|nr:PLP-dependent aminotransferase family protein [Armatimonadota bacterium]
MNRSALTRLMPEGPVGTWLAGFRIDSSSQTPLYLQIASEIEHRIGHGRIAIGERLPPQRALAELVGVSRNTAVQAYRELERRGWVRSRVGRGTFAALPLDRAVPNPSWQPQFSASISRVTRPFMGEVNTEQAGRLSLASGKVAADPSIIGTFRQMFDLVLEREGARAFEPGPPQGIPALRAALAAHLHAGGADVRPQEILITAGARQALSILASILVDPGDTVVTEGPTYRGAIQAFQGVGARIICVPTDGDGLDLEALESVLAYTRPKLIYVIPTFQNPSSVSLSLERRHLLIEAAARRAVPIVEDDPYWELRYEGARLPRLKALDTWGGVIHVGTFSKLVFPGVRVGWIAGPPGVIRQAAVAKAGGGLHVSSLPQWAMARLLEENLLEPHLRRACQRLRSKRDLLLASLARHARGRLMARRPEGGLFVWARLPAPVQAADLLKSTSAKGVDFVAGPAFWPSGGDPYAMRLCFAGLDEPQLEEAAAIVGRSLASALTGVEPGEERHPERAPAGYMECGRRRGRAVPGRRA